MREYWNLYSFDLQWRILKPLHLICCHKNKSQPVVLYDFYAVLYILLKNLLSTHLHKNWTNQYWRYKNTKIIPIGERFNKKNTSCTGRTEQKGLVLLSWNAVYKKAATKPKTWLPQNKMFSLELANASYAQAEQNRKVWFCFPEKQCTKRQQQTKNMTASEQNVSLELANAS